MNTSIFIFYNDTDAWVKKVGILVTICVVSMHIEICKDLPKLSLINVALLLLMTIWRVSLHKLLLLCIMYRRLFCFAVMRERSGRCWKWSLFLTVLAISLTLVNLFFIKYWQWAFGYYLLYNVIIICDALVVNFFEVAEWFIPNSTSVLQIEALLFSTFSYLLP